MIAGWPPFLSGPSPCSNGRRIKTSGRRLCTACIFVFAASRPLPVTSEDPAVVLNFVVSSSWVARRHRPIRRYTTILATPTAATLSNECRES